MLLRLPKKYSFTLSKLRFFGLRKPKNSSFLSNLPTKWVTHFTFGSPTPQHQRMAHPLERKHQKTANLFGVILYFPTERERRGWIFSILKAEEVDPFIFPGQPLLCALAGMDVVMCFLSSWHYVATAVTALTASLAHLLALLLCVLQVLLILLGCKNGFHLLVAYLLPLFA